jgi:hypothetical protein
VGAELVISFADSALIEVDVVGLFAVGHRHVRHVAMRALGERGVRGLGGDAFAAQCGRRPRRPGLRRGSAGGCGVSRPAISARRAASVRTVGRCNSRAAAPVEAWVAASTVVVLLAVVVMSRFR